MFQPLIIITLASFPLLAQGGCPDSLPQSGKKVFCYYEGKKSPQSVDPCPCTHLLYKNVEINSDSQLRLTDTLRSDLEILKSHNPDLSVLLSIGGDSVHSDTFRAIVSRKDQLSNFTESLNRLYQDKIIQGIELDWEWPLDSGDKKDKIKLIRYIRQLKLATGDENIKRRLVRRNADIETTTMFTLEIADDTTITSDETEDDIDNNDEQIITTEWSPARSSDATTLAPEMESEMMETTTENRRRRGYVKKRVKTASRTTEYPAHLETSTSDEERNSLEDILFSDEDNLLESDFDDDKFFVALRLSPKPEQLVKGYEFQMLNKFVDMYTLNSHNLSSKHLNTTFHHSRLMGASDIYNSDALIDVVVGLGVPASRIILNTPAFGHSFSLMDKTVNLPGAATAGLPQTITYQQVCQLLSVGNWTLERDEDLTGPYSFLANKWIAFDDDTSLKIKAKYVLLRDLAGVGLMSIDADDIDNVCGKGKQSLLHTLGGVMTSLQRKPRQLIVTSLEQDLLATAQNFVPVTSAAGLRVSPFRIVRIVDREGAIQSIRQNAETVLECSRQGYYRHPEDCSRFYRCVKFNQYENDYTIFEYGCPEGLVFDDRWEVCVWPAQATPCDGSSEIFPIPKEDYKCPGPGFFVDPENCRWFFACLDHLGDGTYTHYEFRCPFGLAFDEANLRCDWPWLVPACGNVGAGPYVGAGPQLPSRAEFAKSFDPFAGSTVNSSPFPSVASIPSFESSRTAIPQTIPVRKGKTFNDGDNVAKDSCENCFSNVLTITGSGRVNGNGLEVSRPRGQRFRQPKNQQLGPSTTIGPLPSYGSSTTEYFDDNVAAGGYEDYNDDAGYNYPVPSHPLPIQLPTPTTPAPVPTSPPSYNPSTSGYNYPVPANPLPVGISVSNPGENGLIPSHNIPVSVTPNIPAYGLSSSTLPSYGGPSSTTPAPPVISTTYQPARNTYNPPPPPPPQPAYEPVQEYGVPLAPVYEPAEEYGLPLAQPIEEYGVPLSPIVSTSYAPPVTTPKPSYQPSTPITPFVHTNKPAYQPSSTYAPPAYEPAEDYGVPLAPVEDYGVPIAPIVSTVRPAYQPSSTYAPPAYEPEEDYGVPLAPIEEYGVPNAPIVSTERPPYQPAYEPAVEYGVPLAPIVSTVQPAYQPSSTYAPPVTTPKPSYQPSTPLTPFVHTGRPVYSPKPTPYAPVISSTYGPLPAAPVESYGLPLADPIEEDISFDFSLSQGYEEPEESYGVPAEEPLETYGVPAEEPLESYGVPAAPIISTSYKPPVVTTTYRPVTAAPVVTSTYRPAAPVVSSTYRPASLPDSWPQYPGSNEDAFTPPEIQYGGFKPPSPSPQSYKPKPSYSQPSYQQPSYQPTKPDISYGGFKAISPPVTPNIPAYGPPAKPGYSYPVPSNPLVLPQTTRKPAVVYTTAAPSYVSTTAGYIDLPSYGGSPAADTGYEYPVPSNPLKLPQRTGKSHTRPDNTPQVGSVIPVGFSSATLSNGPFSSISSANDNFREEARQPKAFGQTSNNANTITRPTGSGAFNSGNSGSAFRPTTNNNNNQNSGNPRQNLQSFVNFGAEGDDDGRQGSSRPTQGRGNNFGGSSVSFSGAGGDGRDGRQGVRPSQFDSVSPPQVSPFNGNSAGANVAVTPSFGNNRQNGNVRPNSAFTNVGSGRPAQAFSAGESGRPAGNGAFRDGTPSGAGGSGRPAGNGAFRDGTPSGTGGFGSGRPAGNGGFGNGRPAVNGGFGNGRPAGNGGFGNGIPFGNGGSGSGRPSGNEGSGRQAGNGGLGNGRPSGNGGFGSARPAGNGGIGSARPAEGFGNGRPTGNGGFDSGRDGRQGFGSSANSRPSGFGSTRNGRPSGFGSSGNRRPSASSNARPAGNGGSGNGRPSAFGSSGNGRPSGLRTPAVNRPSSSNRRPSGASRPTSFGAGRTSAFGSGSRPVSSFSNPRPTSGNNRRPPTFSSNNDEPRRGKQLGVGVTAVSRPNQHRPAVLGKLAGAGSSAVNNWDSGTWEKFGPGGFRSFNETLGPEVCQRPGLFRHPEDCTKFYECYWDKWIEKFTLHIFPCPVAMAVRQYDESISACNWPFLGPNCEGGNYY